VTELIISVMVTIAGFSVAIAIWLKDRERFTK